MRRPRAPSSTATARCTIPSRWATWRRPARCRERRSRPAARSSCTATTTSTACAPRRSRSRCCACSAPRSSRSCRAASSTATAWPSRRSRTLAARGAGLLLTVDCGIAAPEAVARARELGLDVVVTDHHRPGAVLPDAPIVASRVPSGAGYPFADLCGTGVVLKLAQALWSRRHGGDPAALPPALDQLSDLVALATVADVVPAGRREPRARAPRHAAPGRGRPAGPARAHVERRRRPRAPAHLRSQLPPRAAHQRRRPARRSRPRARSPARELARRGPAARRAARGPQPRAPAGGGRDPARRRAPRSSAAVRSSAAIACSSPRARAGTRA